MCRIVGWGGFAIRSQFWISGIDLFGLRGRMRPREVGRLCGTVHDFSILNLVDRLRLGWRRSGCLLDDVLGGVEAGGVGDIGLGEDLVDGGEGISDMVLGFFANEDGFVELRRVKGVAEAE